MILVQERLTNRIKGAFLFLCLFLGLDQKFRRFRLFHFRHVLEKTSPTVSYLTLNPEGRNILRLHPGLSKAHTHLVIDLTQASNA
ncbi:unnamed protein product [Thlaspi arvense]|uniref:Uncharacterized protein n=1 Tax=Thlaspi arvense TaxID=13288 RepID=A0AAU9T5Z3_THLAR|nr:unnamed protein product [Thlaspi arvense]CAH2078652.1 unnamed protein product [Thlaspi arvense]